MISRTIRVLLMGGIGTGKSTLARFLRSQGALVIDADALGHRVLEEEALEAVTRRWPRAVSGGRVDRAKLAEVVFSDADELRELERITHPHIAARIEAAVTEASESMVIVELPVLPSIVSGDWVKVVITAPAEVRLARMIERGMDPADAGARMASQPSPEEWRAVADVELDNSGGEETIPALAEDLMTAVRSLASRRDTEAP